MDNRFFNEIVSIVEGLLLDPEDSTLKKQLNSLVYELYNIDAQEQAFIVNYLMA